MNEVSSVPVVGSGWRNGVLLGLLLAVVVLLTWRAFDLEVLRHADLQHRADLRHHRLEAIPALRGKITDRNGDPLAVSTLTRSVVADPQRLLGIHRDLGPLARELGLSTDALAQRLESNRSKRFLYLKRRLSPQVAARVDALGLQGVRLISEPKRFYPASEIFGHVIGFTDVNDRGQEGLEAAFDDWLQGHAGHQRVVRDGLRRSIGFVGDRQAAIAGRDLRLSLDRRIQYLAYQGLAEGVQANQAKGGTVVLLDARSGEVLAMVSQPAYNPNDRGERRGGRYRNRAVTDPFEPGSTLKPFTVAAALESGRYTPHTRVDTGNGTFRVGSALVKDVSRNGVIDVATIIRKSSNVGAAKLALSMEPSRHWEFLTRMGFGGDTGSGFPGASDGYMQDWRDWVPVEQATLGFGYGLSTTSLQLARAYTVLASGGWLRPASFLREDQPVAGERVLSARICRQVLTMMEAVTGPEGTAPLGRIPGYRVAGKTGTVHKAQRGGYAKHRYFSLFVGVVPASDPRLVAVVVMDEPGGKQHYGGQVAAPIFSRIVGGALRLLDIPPDDPRSLLRSGALEVST